MLLTHPSPRADLDALLGQQTRLLKLEAALPGLALVPERMVMKEAVSEPFDLTLDCLSPRADIELERLLGEQITLRLLQADGRYKAWHGHIFLAHWLGADGGLARYRLQIRPWLSFLGCRTDSFVYQQKTALEVIEEVFADYPVANFALKVTQPMRRREICVQYRETDLAFVHRLLAEEGLAYRFDHVDVEGAGDTDIQGQARHRLVITDALASRPDLGTVRFARQHVSANLDGQRDAVTGWEATRSVTANAVTLASWDPSRVAGVCGAARTALTTSDLPMLEVYDGAGAQRHEDAGGAERAASLALAAIESTAKRFEGQGSTRHFQAGHDFALVDHPLYGPDSGAKGAAPSRGRPENRFTLLGVEHHAANNLGTDATHVMGTGSLGLTDIERGSYRNHFHCAPAAARVVPGLRRKPTAPEWQTALVVGVDDAPLTTDREQRVRVQFHWQRGERPSPGGALHASPVDRRGNAPGNERSGTWVRVAQAAAGANWGTVFTPRIGTEVSIGFVEGDIDRPFVIGQHHNGEHTPPFSAGVDSGINHAGVISGLHAPTFDRSGFNQWVIDDATGQLRQRLLCDQAASELSLGHVIQQSASSAQRGAWRGSGFEANTQGWTTVRAAQGLLLSSTARAGIGGSAQGTQMELPEALAQLRAASDLGLRLSKNARSAGALRLAPFETDQTASKLLDQIDPVRAGRHAGPVHGQEARKPGADGRYPGSEPVEAFASPVIALDAPSAVLMTSDATIASFAGQDANVVSQGDLHQAAAHTWTSVAGKTSSWYVHAGSVKAFAANGPVSLRAHTDALQIRADKDVTVSSVDDQITISAHTKIELIAGQSSVTLDGENIEFKTPGAFQVKGSAHAFLGGGAGAAPSLRLPDTRLEPYQEQFRALDPSTGEPVAELT